MKNQAAVNQTLANLKHTKPMEHFGTKKYLRTADITKWPIWPTKNLPLKWVSVTHPNPTLFRFIVRRCRNSVLAAEGHGDIQPPEHLRPRIKTCFTPLPTWYPPFEGEVVSDDEYPNSRSHPATNGNVSLVGLPKSLVEADSWSQSNVYSSRSCR